MALDPLVPSLPVTESFAQEYLEYYRLLPLELSNGVLRVAVSGDPNRDVLLDLETTYQARLEITLVPEEELGAAIRRTFARAETVVELVRDLNDQQPQGIEAAGLPLLDVRDLANQAPVVRYVNLLLREAHESEASDIHIESGDAGLRVRFRMDGVLQEVPAPPPGLHAAVASRVKLLAEMDIAERRVPQDGRIRIRLEARELDIRVSTIPTLQGESIVLRLLDRGGRPVSLEDLGLSPEPLAVFRRLARKAHGILLATGPTGSGKTTSVYAALGLREPLSEKIVTVEDPVEYRLQGITQVPVRSKHGMSFASALRSILRQDPDVLFVGEMRDGETAAIAVQAAMTGHLVFSTLHTNDAASALIRLLDLGVEPYLIAATVEGVLAQRLVRRTCPDCRVSYQPDPAVISLLMGEDTIALNGHDFQHGAGCAACHHTGFRGRSGVFELLVVTDEMRQAISTASHPERFRALASRNGFASLKQEGWRKVLAGVTTAEEVLRVIGE
jgi:general secretion pathway protein E